MVHLLMPYDSSIWSWRVDKLLNRLILVIGVATSASSLLATELIPPDCSNVVHKLSLNNIFTKIELPLTKSENHQAKRYFLDTVASLEKMRGTNGLLMDKLWLKRGKDGISVKTQTLNANTSPTNIALDLLVQIERLKMNLSTSPDQADALANIDKILTTLEEFPKHKDSSLFFSWYSQGKNAEVVNKSVSSVDNIHLALALWTLRETFQNKIIGARAGKLFSKMDFSDFYDKKTGLVHGNLINKDNRWIKEAYHFGDLGSESRSVYSLGDALGLFKKIGDVKDSTFSNRAINALHAEVKQTSEGPILALWDGGAFQLLLPEILAGESRRSPALASMFSNYARYTVNAGKTEGIPLPAAYSASNVGIDGQKFFQGASYNGKAGHPELVSAEHVDVLDPVLREQWDKVVTPHALVLAATHEPSLILSSLKKAEQIGKDQDFKLYEAGWGWMDGVHVRGKNKGEVVPVQLSLDQGMIALTLARLLAPNRQSVSETALIHNPEASKRLDDFYRQLQLKLAPLLSPKQ